MKKTVFLVLTLFLFLLLPFPSVFADDWVSPTGFEDPDSKWSNEVNAYDEDTATYTAHATISANTWGSYLVLTIDEITSDVLRMWNTYSGFFSPSFSQVDIYNGSWYNIYDSIFIVGAQFFNYTYSETKLTAMRVRYKSSLYFASTPYVNEVDFWETEETPPNQYELNLNSSPFQNVNFTLNGTTYQTNYTDILDEGYYNVTFPSAWVNNSITYIFKNWSDGTTDPSRILNLNANTTLTATYVLPPPTPKAHILFVGASLVFGLIGFVFILSRKKK